MRTEKVFDGVLRTATHGDIKAITKAQLAMAWESERLRLVEETVTRGVQHVVENPTLGFYLVAEAQGEVVAVCMILHEWSDWRCGRILWLHSLYVNPQCRRQGVFRAIYQHLQNLVKNTPDLHGIRLYVDNSNHVAQQTYQAIGMSNDHYTLYEWLQT